MDPNATGLSNMIKSIVYWLYVHLFDIATYSFQIILDRRKQIKVITYYHDNYNVPFMCQLSNQKKKSNHFYPDTLNFREALQYFFRWRSFLLPQEKVWGIWIYIIKKHFSFSKLCELYISLKNKTLTYIVRASWLNWHLFMHKLFEGLREK